ncbi:MAG: hypothetical protein A2W80_01285 [Candidatus Riflebacteria bacterium GWC2_50_8]|nr:MAG: hypothetical protein A2W80_01285 [Candidatus Riflebacteria bacterium GWC2_50_8]
MIKRFIPTAVALLILLTLLVYANYFETSDILQPGAQKPEPILGCSAGEITAITWKRPGDESIKLVIASESSKLVLPGELASDKNEADGLLRHFAELKYEMVVAENASDTSGYGIDSDSPTVIIEAGNRSWEIYLGSKSEIGGSYYLAKKDDPRVFIVPGYIRGDFAKSLDDLRDRRWFAEDFGQVDRINITTPESAVELRLGESFSEWFVDQPASYSADGVAVAEIIERLRNLKISRFVDDNPAENEDYGFADPGLVITLSNREGRVFSLETGETAGTETYVRRPGIKPIHASLNSELNELKRNANDLREKYLVMPRHDHISELTVADASASITIERKENQWLIGDQVVADADIKAFLSALGQSRIFSFGKLEKLEEHGLHVKEKCRYIDIKDPDQPLTLWLGVKQGINLSVMDRKELMLISAEVDDALKLLMRRIRSEQQKTVIVPQNATATESSGARESSQKNSSE